MSDQLGLFGSDPPPAARAVGPAEVSPERRRLAASLPRGVRLGTSSWSFPGWAGLVYDREVSQRVLAREGLGAYAAHPLLDTVGIDRTWYRSLSADDFRAYADAVPPGFRFLVKADRLVTSPLDPSSGSVRERNPLFLDPAWAADTVVAPVVRGLGDAAGPLLFQFSPFPASLVDGPAAFARRLGRFLRALPRGPTYAVELRTPALLGEAYAAALAEAGVAHGHVVHPAMAPLAEQLRIFPPEAAPALVIRWMLHAGLRYEAAKDRYAPFDRLVDEDVASRTSIAGAVAAAAAAGREAFVVVNNKAEGSAPLSVARLAARIAEEAGPDPAATLRWIAGLLRRHGVPFQVVGGLAARAWGATRPLADLDLYVPRAGVERILPEIEPLLTRPLGSFEDEHWRIRFLQLVHRGTRVELGVAEGARFRNRATGRFEPQAVDFEAGVERPVLGVTVPVMPRAPLVAYKEKLDRPVDRRDLAEMAAAKGRSP